MYTIDWIGDEGVDRTQQEIDIEFLTHSFKDKTGQVHFAVHAPAEGLKSFDTRPDIALDFNPSDDFHVWGFEITPEKIEWFIDDKVLLSYKYSEHEVAITRKYQLKFNVWTNTPWIKGPPSKDVKTLYQIDWVKFYPYKTNK